MQKLSGGVFGSALLIAAAQALVAMAEGDLRSMEIAPVTEGHWYRPAVGVSWQWQLLVDDEHPLNTTYAVDVYNLDLFETSSATIKALQGSGHRVICYFSAGTYENYSQDRQQFAREVLGNEVAGWPEERWLDIRSPSVERIMTEPLDMAARKGCDAVEPDNVQGYLEDTGFDFSAQDQLAYNRFIANQAHRRGLAVGLKNDLEQISELVDYFDFTINEQCFQYHECEQLMPFIAAGKPVLNVEYPRGGQKATPNAESVADLCIAANELGFSTLILPLELDGRFRVSCQR
ncbi:MAG: endo alpha-1,4 polygalactosaminidase [Halopseudomonas sp.]|uniref:endo alpha-1,4 polygalactosaminidase n=1 Tax=Halopseudomonas sp. TaxID=2901191 RepID=UPI003002A0C2